MAQITKLFTKGLDTDTAPHLQDKESYSSAMNVHFSLGSLLGPSDGQGGGMESYNTGGDAGVIEPFAGNTDWTSLFTSMPGLNPFVSNRNYVRGYDKDGAKCIGYATDDTESLSSNTRYIYLFIYTPQYGNPIETANSYIVKVALQYDASGSKITTIKPSQSSVLLNGEWVNNSGIDDLGFLPTDFISARVSGNQLIFTDNRNNIRYVDVNKDYYTNKPSFEELSLITEPGHVPLTSVRGSSATDPIIIQKNNYQFTYRITNEDNFISVLAPYSVTSLSARQEEITALSYSSNIVTIDLDKAQVIPDNWKKIEFVAINLETASYQVIRVFDKYDQTSRTYNFGFGPVSYTDAQLVADHNDPGAPFIFITYQNWNGTNIQYTLSSTEAFKQFDSLPITSKALELASNRLFLANNLEGYNTPATPPDIPADVTTGLYTAPTSAQVSWGSSPAGNNGPILGGTPTLLMVRNQGASTGFYYCCIITRDYVNGVNYGFPVDCGTIIFEQSNPATVAPDGTLTLSKSIDGYSGNLIELPHYISEKSLIKLNETGDPKLEDVYNTPARGIRLNILKELNEFAANVVLGTTGDEFIYPLSNSVGQNCIVLNAAAYASGLKQRAFYPNSSYEYGIQYYDSALRKSGVKKINSINVPTYEPVNKQLLEYVDFDTTITQAGGVIPSWANYYSICVAKNTKASNFISFMPDMMRFAYKNADGVLVYDQNETSTKLEYYGLAIPLSSLYKDGLGYSYTAGDLCELNIKPTGSLTPVTLTYPVINAIDGYVILGADRATMLNYISAQINQIFLDSSAPSPWTGASFSYPVRRFQEEIFVSIYTPVLTTPSEYEVAMFGEITSSTTFGTPFNISGSQLFGDTYTQSRDAQGGSQMMLSKARYEINQINWIHDFGRIAPIDNIGQKQLTNSIRWSNVKLPNSNVNGLSTFDALDETSVDQSSGPITTIFLSSKEANQGGRMLVLCNSGSYIALIGQQQIYSADQTPALTSSAGVLGTILPLTNLWGCISPQSVVGYKGIVFWADALNREIIQFAGDGASPISQQKAGFLWNQVFRNLPFDDSANSAANIKCGINPYTYELFVTCPNPSITGKQYPGNCGDNHINQYIGNKNVSYVYNWQANTWIGGYEDNPDQWIRVGDDVFSIGSQYGTTGLKLYKEFDNTTGVFNQATTGAWIAAPYSIGTYPATIEPLSVILMGQLTTTSTVIYARDNSTNVNNNLTQISLISDGNYAMREGEMFSSVYRNRLSNNATTNTEYDTQNIVGDRIRTKTPWVQLNFPTNQQINLQGIRLEVKQSSGH
jgi:hypothetical protein